jgi:two-component system, LytTR family, sensor kinase
MKKYWLYQLSGWSAYSAVGITINLIGGGLLMPLLLTHAVLVPSGIGMTHLLRREVHRRRSPSAPVSALWPLLTLGSLAISIVLAAIVIGLNQAMGNGNWDAVSMIALWWGMLLATGVWSVLYIRFSERRGQQEREDQLHLALREARLLALEAQINPHFLFNALNSIRALVVIDPPGAQDMLTRLANVLRNSLRRDDEHTVTLGSELESVSDYLALETIRFADRLHSSVVTDEEAARCQIPPMVLQTLVENAVKHGVGEAAGPTDLLVRASVDNKKLFVAVENTGKLLDSRREGVRLGLKNTRERLKLLYGDAASLRLEQSGDRVVATVAIPMAE